MITKKEEGRPPRDRPSEYHHTRRKRKQQSGMKVVVVGLAHKEGQPHRGRGTVSGDAARKAGKAAAIVNLADWSGKA